MILLRCGLAPQAAEAVACAYTVLNARKQ